MLESFNERAVEHGCSAGVVNYTSLKIQVDDRNAAPEARKQIENIGFLLSTWEIR